MSSGQTLGMISETYIRYDIGYDIIYYMNVWGVTLYRNIKMLACMASLIEQPGGGGPSNGSGSAENALLKAS
jgi:hypothetical protein